MRLGRPPLRPLPWLAALVALVLAGATRSPAQVVGGDVQLSSGVEPDVVTVGDPFRVGIRVTAPEGVEVRFPAFSDPTGSLEILGAPRLVRDPDDPRTAVHVYPLVAWRTAPEAPVLPVELHLPDRTVRTVRMALPLPEVRSVIPTELADPAPRDHRGIVDAEVRRARWPWLVLALVIAALALYAYRRLRRVRTSAVPPANPREWALAELERARAEWIASEDRRPFFSALSGALRGYLASGSPRWGADLTTRELVAELRAAGVEPERVRELHALLDTADGVKFARVQVAREAAEHVWTRARDWVRTDRFADVSDPVDTREAA